MAEVSVAKTQVPGEPAQYNGWTGAELLALVARLEAENKRLEALIGGAVGVMEKWNVRNRWGDIIAELRKAVSE